MRRLIVPIALLTSTLFACSEATTPPSSVAPETQSQKSVIKASTVPIGTGINDAKQGSSISNRFTDRVCTSGDTYRTSPGLEGKAEWTSRSFYTSSPQDIERRARSEFEGQLSGPPIAQEIQRTIQTLNNVGYSEHNFLLHIAIRVVKIERGFKEEPDGSETVDILSYCAPDEEGNGGHNFADFQTFNQECGTRYVDHQEIGGWVVLTTKLSEASAEMRAEIAGALRNNEGASSNLSFSQLKGQLNDFYGGQDMPIQKLYMNVVGLKEPSMQEVVPGSGVYLTSLSTLDSYKKSVDAGFDFPDEKFVPTNEILLDTIISKYGKAEFNACGLNGSANERQYQCVTEAYGTAAEFQDSTGKIGKILGSIKTYVNNPADFNWSNNRISKTDKLNTLKEDIEDCQEAYKNTLHSKCTKTVNSGNISDFCSECGIPDGCSIKDLETRHETLTEGITRDRGRANHESFEQYGNGSVQFSEGGGTSLCVMQKVNGLLALRSDEIRVHMDEDPDGDSKNEWQLSVTQPTSRHLDFRSSGRMACVIKPEFTDTSRDDPDFDVDSEWLTDVAYSGYPTEEEVIIDQGTQDAALNRYNGSSNGLGEYAMIERPPAGANTFSLKANSEAHANDDEGIQGGAHKFGFRTSDRVNGPIAWTDKYKVNSNGDRDQQLVPVDEAICYLTKVSGEFDGGGEYASISQEEYHWHLKVGSVCHGKAARWLNADNCDRKEIKAKARCYYYDH